MKDDCRLVRRSLRLQLYHYLPNWLAASIPNLAKKETWLMVKKDLERIDIPYRTKEGVADSHAVGRHSYITGLARSGASLVQVKELARHGDIRMTMGYTHVGIDEKAEALNGLVVSVKLRTFNFCRLRAWWIGPPS